MQNPPKKISSSSLAENFHERQEITVYHPSDLSKRLKHRKVVNIMEKYSTLRSFFQNLKDDFQIISFQEKRDTETQEERLVSYTHKILSIESSANNQIQQVLVPIKRVASVKVFSLDRALSRDQKQYKCLYDYHTILFVAMSIRRNKSVLTNGNAEKNALTNGNAEKNALTNGNAEKNALTNGNAEDSTNESDMEEKIFDINIQFDFICINAHNFETKRFSDTVNICKKYEDMEFALSLSGTLLVIVWADENFITSLNLKVISSKFEAISLIKGVSKEFTLRWKRQYLAITEKDHDFIDNVFSEKDISKRRTVFYKINQDTLMGHEFLCSHKMLTRIYEKEHLDYPSDIIFVDIPNNPLWVVKEWNLPDITLKKLLFYYEKSDELFSLEFEKDCQNYEKYFQTPDEYQMSGFQICNLTLQLFLWCSKQHILVVNLKSHKIDFILELTTKQYFDFKNEFHHFKIDLTRFGRDIRVLIKKGHEYVHYERFQLPIVNSLKDLVKMTLVLNFSRTFIESCSLLQPKLKDEVLMIF